MTTENPRRSFRVPAKRPPLLQELKSRLRSVDVRWTDLHAASDPLLFDDLADFLDKLFTTAAELAPQRGGTDCPEHRKGPVDPEPPEGWGACLLCNLRRRRGRLDRIPPPASRAPGWTIPESPHTFEALAALISRIWDAVFELRLTSRPQEFTAVADLVHQAFVIARELSRPNRAAPGCPRHPGGPVESARDGGGCILCRVRERHGADPVVILRPPRAPRRVLERRHVYVDDTGADGE